MDGAVIYVAVGWTTLGFAPTLSHQLGVVTFSLIVVGGVVYSVGAIVYSTRRPDPVPAVFGFHEVFHAVVIAAGLVFYAAIVRGDRGCVTVEQADVVIVGGGLLGLSTAWALRGRRDVLVLERDTVGHARGGSHGPTRIFRLGYADPRYVAMAQRRGAVARARGRGGRAAVAPDTAAHVRAGRRRGVRRAARRRARRPSASPRPRSSSGSPRSPVAETRCWRWRRR